MAPPVHPGPVLRRVLRAPGWLYRWQCGWLLGSRFLLLIHRGRRTGRLRHTVLEVMEFRREGPEAIVMSGWGRNSQWLRNIQSRRTAEVVIGSRRFTAAIRILGTDEAVGVIAGYERRNVLIAPIIRLVLSRLVGWRYDGSDLHRRRLVAELPLVGFRLCPPGD